MDRQSKREMEKRRMERNMRTREIQRRRRRRKRRILVLAEIVVMIAVFSFMAYELSGKTDFFSNQGGKAQTEKIGEASAVNTDILETVLSNVKFINKEAYTQESVAQLEASVSKAETYMKKKNISQEEIEEVYVEVITGIQHLQKHQ